MFKVTRYRPSPSGTLNIDVDQSAAGGTSAVTNSTNRGGGRKSAGGTGGTIGNVYVLFEKRRGKPGERVNPDLFPTVTWVCEKDGTRNPGDMEDRAAKYVSNQNYLLVNADFRAFADMISYWYKESGGSPTVLPTVEDVVRSWFEQALVETVLGVQALRNSKLWNVQHIDAALSEEALTSAVMQRYHVHNAVKRELSAKLGKLSKSKGKRSIA